MSGDARATGATPEVNCPTCRKPVRWEAASTHRPFCSERCRLIDLGAWASERYSIPVETPPDQDGFDLPSER